MRSAKSAILAIGASIALIASAQSPAKTRNQANVTVGKELYRQNCSTCHGMDGKGPGPGSSSIYDPESLEPEKRVKPADLTALSDQNSGTFPADRVRNAIYFKGAIPAHGTPEMPAWGDKFYLLKSDEKALGERVRDLTAYIESIQTATQPTHAAGKLP